MVLSLGDMWKRRIRHLMRLLIHLLLVRNFWIIIAFAAITILLASEASRWFPRLVSEEDKLRALQQSAPVRAAVLGLAIYFIACFLPGTNGKAIVFGWLFGGPIGTLLINVASTAAAFLMFFASRSWLRSYLLSRYGGHLVGINRRVAKEGGVYLFALRVVPIVPYTLLNALMGVTPMRLRTFWWATQLGMLPSNIAFATTGASLPGLREVKEQGATAFVTPQLACALALLVALPIMARLLMRRLGKFAG